MAVVTEEKQEEKEAQPEPEVPRFEVMPTPTDEGFRDKTKDLTNDINGKSFKEDLRYRFVVFLMNCLYVFYPENGRLSKQLTNLQLTISFICMKALANSLSESAVRVAEATRR